MIKPKAHTEDRVVSKEKSKEGFKSSFKTWIRVVAFIVAAVFLPEQVAQAVEYDWRVLWHKPVIGLPSNNTFALEYDSHNSLGSLRSLRRRGSFLQF